MFINTALYCYDIIHDTVYQRVMMGIGVSQIIAQNVMVYAVGKGIHLY